MGLFIAGFGGWASGIVWGWRGCYVGVDFYQGGAVFFEVWGGCDCQGGRPGERLESSWHRLRDARRNSRDGDRLHGVHAAGYHEIAQLPRFQNPKGISVLQPNGLEPRATAWQVKNGKISTTPTRVAPQSQCRRKDQVNIDGGIGLWHGSNNVPQPPRGCGGFFTMFQGWLVSAFIRFRHDEPTLGWRAESRWDSRTEKLSLRRPAPHPDLLPVGEGICKLGRFQLFRMTIQRTQSQVHRKDSGQFTFSSGDHGARSARRLWGNQFVAGLGSHQAGMRAGVKLIAQHRRTDQ